MSPGTDINLKDGMPPVAQAIDHLKFSVERARRQGYKCAVIIHGYGSTGKGGIICSKARQWLSAQERNGKLNAVIPGEEFTLFNTKALTQKNRYSELKNLLDAYNHGITIIEL